jgi:hypothetical protein
MLYFDNYDHYNPAKRAVIIGNCHYGDNDHYRAMPNAPKIFQDNHNSDARELAIG